MFQVAGVEHCPFCDPTQPLATERPHVHQGTQDHEEIAMLPMHPSDAGRWHLPSDITSFLPDRERAGQVAHQVATHPYPSGPRSPTTLRSSEGLVQVRMTAV